MMRTRIVGTPSVAATVGWSRIAMASRLAGERAIQMPIRSTLPSATRYTQNRLRSLVAASIVERRDLPTEELDALTLGERDLAADLAGELLPTL